MIICLGILCGLLPLLAQAQDDDNPVQKLVDGALADFDAKKYDTALTKLLEAEKTDTQSAFIQNLIGAAYTKKKDYAKAKQCFEKALDLQPGFFPAEFNVGELLFLQKQYPQALAHFVKMQNADPENELLQFKLVLCLLMTDQQEEAVKLGKRMKFPGDSPAWYFSQAAIEMKAKNKSKARGYLATAESIFPDKTSLYKETFEDLGWPTN